MCNCSQNFKKKRGKFSIQISRILQKTQNDCQSDSSLKIKDFMDPKYRYL